MAVAVLLHPNASDGDATQLSQPASRMVSALDRGPPISSPVIAEQIQGPTTRKHRENIPESKPMIVIKAQLDNEIRRVPMSRFPGELTYDELCIIIERLFKLKQAVNPPEMILKYVDEDGDKCMLENDIDISHALSMNSCLRVIVERPSTSAQKSPDSPPSAGPSSIEALKASLLDVKERVDVALKALSSPGLVSNRTADGNKPESYAKLNPQDLTEFLPKATIQPDVVPPSPASSIASTPAPQQQQYVPHPPQPPPQAPQNYYNQPSHPNHPYYPPQTPSQQYYSPHPPRQGYNAPPQPVGQPLQQYGLPGGPPPPPPPSAYYRPPPLNQAMMQVYSIG
ncbi:hypothetical protein SeMB42_g06343 [Synchytrium endobioticum]|uniref:PB1 domain-containing protein n=1 Tax=Synchytrium endobioticum TaxID=286115 RepID=A0A507CEL4_9FUNG|nr:hypothetical protein SeMB42_g06343 [Synchytrium endobioticum]